MVPLNLIVKPVSEIDLPELIRLNKELIDEECNLEKMRALFHVIQQESNYYLLGAYVEGHLVGSLTGIVCHDLFGRCIPYMLVENVIVSDGNRQGGVGSKLMGEIERIAKERGCRYVMLISSAERKAAHVFYHARGYKSEDYRGFKKFL